MTTASLSPVFVQRFADNNGNPLFNGQLTSFAAGTNTPIATYSDSTGVNQNANPVILNARGEANIWILPNIAYKFQLSDALGNLIWTVDQVVNSQLTTLFGGNDTGSVNAYVINFVANFTSLVNGIVIYWIPSNTNTGASTLNVNGLGVINIVNQDGTPLGISQIVAGGVTAVIYYNGQWLLTSATGSVPKSGTFTSILTSGANVNPGAAKYTVSGTTATVFIPFMAVTVIGGVLTITGFPAVLQPATVAATSRFLIAVNNGSAIDTCIGVLQPGSGTMTLCINGAGFPSGTGWSGSSSIGVHSGLINYGQTITYGLF